MRPPGRTRLLVASQPLVAGVPHHVLDLVRSLDPARFEIHVACPRTSVVWSGLEDRADVSLHAISPAREPSPADLSSLAALVRLAGGADVVHAHSSKAGFLARLAAAARRRRRACIFTPHGWSFWAADGAQGRLYTVLERAAARWCRTIVALSAHERDAGLAAGVGRPDQYRVIPNGIDLDRFALPRAPVRNRVLMVGRLAPPKRPDLAVRALARVRERLPDAELHLVGDGPDQPAVEALVRDLGLGDGVRLLGPRDDVPRLLAGAACVLLASDYEGAPLSVVEAMAAGAPVIAARVGGIPEIVAEGRTGVLVEPGDPEALAAGLAEVLVHPERAEAMGAAGRGEARRRFSLETMVRELVALYDEAATTRS